MSLATSANRRTASDTTAPGGSAETSNFIKVAFATLLSGHVYVLIWASVLWFVVSSPMKVSCGARVRTLLPFITVMLTVAEVEALPASSRAMAVSIWPPSTAVVVFQDIEYGEVVSSVPRLAPSSLNCTPTTETLSLAFAETVTVAEMVAPPAGAVMETDGGVVSFAAVTVMPAEVVTLPAASRATAVSVWLPLATAVVFQDTE